MGDAPAPLLQPVLTQAPPWMLRPGSWLLESAFLTIDSDLEIAIAALISIFAYTTAARLLWSLLGRVFGFYHYAHFRFFLWTPWRPFFRLWVHFRDWWRKLRYGDKPQARMAGFWETASMTAGGRSFPLGRLNFKHITLFQMVGFNPQAHIMMFGGTGGGKTVSIVTALAAHKGSSIVIDPSAQVTNVLHASCGQGGEGILGKGQPSYCLDPDGYVRRPGFVSNVWNIFDEWDRVVERKGPDEVVKLAFTLSEALIIEEKSSQPYFPQTAARMVEGLSLFIYDEFQPGDPRRSLVHFRYLLSTGLDEPERMSYKLSPQEWLLFRMEEKGDKYGGVIAARARQVQEGSKQGGGDVLSTLRTQTAWLDLPPLQKISQGKSDFSFEDFKKGRAHLSICAKVTDIQKMYAGWFRLLTMTALYTFEDIPSDLTDKCLLVVDECPNLGRIAVLDKAPAHVRKFGLRLVLIAQDIGGMREVYPNVEGMIGNAAATIWLATDNDQNVAEILKKLGQHEVREKVDGGHFVWQDKPRYMVKDRPLMDVSDIKEFLDQGNIIVTRRRRHLLLKPAVYFKDLPVWGYDPDPDYEEPAGRDMLRGFCRAIIRGPRAQASPPEAKTSTGQGRSAAPEAPKRPPREQPPKSSAKPSAAVDEGMSVATAKSIYGLTNGRIVVADILARDDDVMAAGHGNAEYEAKVFQARAVLMQHVGEG